MNHLIIFILIFLIIKPAISIQNCSEFISKIDPSVICARESPIEETRCGYIYKIKSKENETLYLLKKYKKSELCLYAASNENNRLNSIQTRYFLRNLKLYKIEDEEYLKMEYVENFNSFEYFVNNRELLNDSKFILQFILKVSQAVEELHVVSVIHTGIKLENVGFNEADNAKLSNLEFSVPFNTQSDFPIDICYTSPEDVERGTNVVYTFASDAYAIGIMLYQMTQNFKNPFECQRKEYLEFALEREQYTIHKPTHPLIVFLIHKLLLKNPNDRFKLFDVRDFCYKAIHVVTSNDTVDDVTLNNNQDFSPSIMKHLLSKYMSVFTSSYDYQDLSQIDSIPVPKIIVEEDKTSKSILI